jgi:hypothetical protein
MIIFLEGHNGGSFKKGDASLVDMAYVRVSAKNQATFDAAIGTI